MDIVTKDDFANVFARILKRIGIKPDLIHKFITEEVPLKKIGICMALTDVIDNSLKKTYPNYDGCLPSENLSTIYVWNFMNNNICCEEN